MRHKIFVEKKKWMIPVLFFIGFTSVWAQISEGGLPPSFGEVHLRSSKQPYEAPVQFNVDELLEEDQELETLGFPPRCAKIIPADISFENNGERIILPDGQRIRRLEIFAPDALAILLYYDKFIIPEEGKLFIYDPEYANILGAYTHKTNSKKTEFATEFIPGDKLILEYVEPASGELPELKISGIAYGYNHIRGLTGDNSLKTRWDSESCMINVNCPEGDKWQDQKKGVARILTSSGGYVLLCSGTLINNTAGNFDPLFLSAHHCYEDMTAAQMNQSIYYFHYEWTGCENLNTDPKCPTMVGAQMLADIDIRSGSDGALLRLNDPIPQDYEVYFNGWDRRNIAATGGVGIHHPAGDVKKISTYGNSVTSDTWDGEGITGAKDAHWNLQFIRTTSGHSVTEGGSSGSPMFDQNGLVVGTLTGGNSSCSYKAGDNLYGKLWYHWDLGPQKMSNYLDPTDSGAEFIEGVYLNYDATKANFFTKEKVIYATQKIEFFDDSRNATSWEWTFEGGTPAVSNEKNPPLIAFNEPGFHKVSLTVDKGTEKEHTKSIDIEVVIKENNCLNTIAIGNETSQSQFPLGISQRQLFSSSLYTKEELALKQGDEITQIAWNAGSANSKMRTIYIYLKETDETLLTASTWQSEITGATLVYESPNNWTNEVGWVTIPLPAPFKCSGNKNLKVIVRTLATSNSDFLTSNCYYSESTERHLRWISNNRNEPIGLGTVNNNRPNIQIVKSILCGVNQPVADFLVNASNEEATDFYVGDTIFFTSLSTGPVVNWEWSFPGATQENSRKENPVAIYAQQGTYTVTLTVHNHLGSNTQQKDLFIKGKIPVAKFSSSVSEGFTTYPNYGKLLPLSGGTVSFQDESKYNPAFWQWEFEGRNPNIYEGNTVALNFPSGEKTYSVTLTVGNEIGSVTKEIENYIKVGGTAPIWNMPYEDQGDTYYQISENAYLTGTNSDYAVIVEKFTNNSAGIISQLDYMIKVIDEEDPSSRIFPVAIYNEKDGKPDKTLATFNLTVSDINRSGYTTIACPTPVSVSGNFYIGIKSLTAATPKIAIGSSQESDPTVYVYKNESWVSLEEVDTQKRKISLNIIPTFTYSASKDTKISLIQSTSPVKIYPNPVNDYLNVSSQSPIEKIVIQDIQGRRVSIVNTENKTEIVLPVSYWVRGVYILKIQTKTGVSNYKITKK
ncbi:MAG: PKD domain-containing protein [Dysgonamonadaceae bacterium]|jgi:PKD repeat protein|nr:PKD domain-containing protein [Dysgonamonadaceae bacterium]